MVIITQFEANLDQVNRNYFCTDQTNCNQLLTSRNFYDSSEIDLFIPNTNIVIGSQLYSSVNVQKSSDFSNCLQNIQNMVNINYKNIVGTLIFNYSVINSDYIKEPVISKVQSVSGIFNNIDLNVYIQKVNDTNKVLYTIYSN